MKICNLIACVALACVVTPQEDDLFTKGGMPKNKASLFGKENTLLNGVPERYHFLYQRLLQTRKLTMQPLENNFLFLRFDLLARRV